MSRCPDDRQLRRYLEETLDAAGLDAVEAHVEGCPHCQAALERLTAGGAAVLPLLLDRRLPAGDHLAAAATAVLANDHGPPSGVGSGRDGRDRPRPPFDGRDDGGRYELAEEVGRGGIGAVFRARDGALNRDVAVKVLLEEYRRDADAERRLLAEAELTGGLQHPGIVPVYDKGRLPDGRPFFAMKLVRGRTLARLLAERPDPAQDRPRLLAVFEQVCQAVAYAHDAGVLHRDLKPSNVMVGAFGEVQVMDWGLAKVLQKDEGGRRKDEKDTATGDASSFLLPPSSFSEGTQAGAVLGTPAYMAPEQARGELSRLDARADVFALGGILCHILTGRPPFPGSDDEALGNARAGALGEALAGLAGCGADAALVRLAGRCLAAEPEGRPPDAGALARELGAYQEGVAARLRRAELARAAAEVRAREERKRRRVQLALGGAVLLLFAVGGCAAWLVQQQRQERAREQQQARAADAQRQQQETDRVVLQCMKEARLHQRTWPPFKALVAAKNAVQLAREGPASEPVRQQAEALLDELQSKKAVLAPVPVPELIPEPVPAPDVPRPGGGMYKDQNPEAIRLRPDLLRERVPPNLHREEWIEYALEATKGKPADPEVRYYLGLAQYHRGRLAEAEAFLAEAIRLKPDFPQALNTLGAVLFDQERDAAAEAAFREAIRRNCDFPEAYCNLGNVLYRQRRYPESAASFREAIRHNPGYPKAHCNRGLALIKQGKFTEALEPFRRGDALEKKNPFGGYRSGELVRECEELVELDRKLSAVLRGEAQADAADRIKLAVLCQQYKRMYAAAARFYLDAPPAEPEKPSPFRRPHHYNRYNAACAAALAGGGQGEDAKNLPDKVAAMFRRQALAWLRADLAVYNNVATKRAVRQRLEHWQKDADLAPLRDKDALDKLPAAEQEACRQLWADVAALLRQVQVEK